LLLLALLPGLLLLLPEQCLLLLLLLPLLPPLLQLLLLVQLPLLLDQLCSSFAHCSPACSSQGILPPRPTPAPVAALLLQVSLLLNLLQGSAACISTGRGCGPAPAAPCTSCSDELCSQCCLIII
jgi:hypothetical protein